MSDFCTQENIDRASKMARKKMLGNWFVAGLVTSTFLFIYWVFLGHALYGFLFRDRSEHICFCGDQCLFNFSWSFIITGQIIWNVCSFLYFVNHGWGEGRMYRPGVIKDDAVQSWTMNSCAQNNYPIVLDISGFYELENKNFGLGASCAMTNACVAFLCYLWLFLWQCCMGAD